MIMSSNNAFLIKSRLSMPSVVERYGFKPNRGGFICCPFHDEKTPSMKIYQDSYHCFGCGQDGDVISFVMNLFGLPFTDACKQLDADFGLDLFRELSYDEVRRMRYKRRAEQARRDRQAEEVAKLDSEYWSAYDTLLRLERNLRKYKPRSPDDSLHPLFNEALQKISYQRNEVDYLDMRRIAYANHRTTDIADGDSRPTV